MAGYDGYSMSKNARQAYDHGRMPASALASEIGRGATAKAVAMSLFPTITRSGLSRIGVDPRSRCLQRF